MRDVRTILDRLVSFDTTSRRSNLELIDYVEDLLLGQGAACLRVPNQEGTKTNLLARMGPDVEGGVVLCGHTDCVPVDGQVWSTDPFTVHEAEGRLYGRGTSDMKGFIAVALSLLPRMASAELERPILFALTYDEEVGTVGAPSAAAALLEAWARPAAVIVGEPTSMEVATDHKGVWAFTTQVVGLDGHSSQPQHAANAIAAASRIAVHIDELAAAHRDGAADPNFSPPYTTFNLATIEGGTAINIVPRRSELRWEYRPVPADDNSLIAESVERFARDEVLTRLREPTGVGEITFVARRPTRSLEREQNGAAEALARELAGYDGGRRSLPFGTDGGHFQAAGFSTVVCGPGSIDQAHTADEWVEIGELEACQRFVERLIDHQSR